MWLSCFLACSMRYPSALHVSSQFFLVSFSGAFLITIGLDNPVKAQSMTMHIRTVRSLQHVIKTELKTSQPSSCGLRRPLGNQWFVGSITSQTFFASSPWQRVKDKASSIFRDHSWNAMPSAPFWWLIFSPCCQGLLMKTDDGQGPVTSEASQYMEEIILCSQYSQNSVWLMDEPHAQQTNALTPKELKK